MTDPTWHPKLRDDLKLQPLDDGAIVLDRANERLHQLNDVGAYILELADGGRSVTELAAEVVTRYDVSDTKARSDTEELIDRMRALGIVV